MTAKDFRDYLNDVLKRDAEAQLKFNGPVHVMSGQWLGIPASVEVQIKESKRC